MRTIIQSLLLSSVFLLVALAGANAQDPLGMVVVQSQNNFADTLSGLETALDNNPNIKVIAKIDHSAAASAAGVGPLLPNTLLVFGNPNLGTPIMQADRRAGLDLPQKMLVWALQDGTTFVGYNPPSYLEFRHAVAGVAQLTTIATALSNFASAATGVAAGDIRALADGLPYPSEPGLDTVSSDADFETTWDRLLTAIGNSPASVAFTVDHGLNAENTNDMLVLGPTRLVVFGNPRLGTPLMQAKATAGIDLPLKLLVWQDDTGTTQVTTNSVAYIQQRHVLPDGITAISTITGAIGNFVRAATTTTLPSVETGGDPHFKV